MISVIWGKLIVNESINPLTALLNLTNGMLIESEQGRKLISKVVDEAVKVASARGVHLPYADAYSKVSLPSNSFSFWSGAVRSIQYGS